MRKLSFFQAAIGFLLAAALVSCANPTNSDSGGTPEATSLTAPTNFTASYDPVTNTSTLEWKAVDSATGYYVYKSTTDDFSSATKINGSVTTAGATISNYTAMVQTFYYWVTAFNSSTESENSASASITTTTVSPANLTIKSIDDKKVTLSWDTVEGITEYDAYLNTTDDSSTAIYKGSVTTNGATLELTDLAIGKIIYLWVVTVKGTASTSSTPSAHSEFTSPVIISLLAATDMITTSGTPTESSVTVTWNAVANATSYAVYYGTQNSISSATKFGTTDKTVLEVTNLNSGTLYYFWVRAIANNLEGTCSDATQKTTKIAIPTDFTVSEAKDTSVELSWNNSTGAKSYTVAYDTADNSSTATTMTAVTANSTSVTGLSPKTTYYFWIKATDSNSYTTAYSASITTTTLSSRPTGVKVSTATNSSPVLTWTAVTGASSYRVWKSTSTTISSAEKDGTTDTTEYTLTGLTSGITYYFWVEAYVDGAWSCKSDVCSSDGKFWLTGSVSTTSECDTYTFTADGTSSYSVYWADYIYSGTSDTYTGRIRVSATDSNGNSLFTDYFNGTTSYCTGYSNYSYSYNYNYSNYYRSGESITPPAGTVTITVCEISEYNKYSSNTNHPGTYAISVSSATLTASSSN